MLGTRVLTAAVALIILIGAAFVAPPFAFDVLLLAIVSAACFEWLKLLDLSSQKSGLIAAALFGLSVSAFYSVPAIAQLSIGLGSAMVWLYAVAAMFWVVGVPFALSTRRALGGKRLAGQVLAIFLCLVTGFALLHADGLGKGFLLSVLLLVWVADTAAYFSGRALGKRKLAPQISPGKTWEGVVGALLANTAMAIVLASMNWVSQANPAGTVFSWMASSLGYPLMIAFTILLTLVSVAGDLYESLLKRIAGVKDSGNLLPGHGGVFDRIDALLAVFPVTMFLVALMQSGQLGR